MTDRRLQKGNFWARLKKPILALAPMYDVTDSAFRFIIAKYGKPDVSFTEFVSADGLFSPGRDKLMHILKYDEIERPIVAQIFGVNPENFFKATKLIIDLGFDGVDINFGCPDKNVVKKFAGCGVIKKPELAHEIILACKEAANGKIPVSVKTRTGYSTNIVEEWTAHLLEVEPAALTIHARTKKEMSKVPADWNSIKKAVDVRNNSGKETLIIGNGDVQDLADAKAKVNETGCDGVMLGRAIFGNPWRFNKKITKEELSPAEILAVLNEHTKLFEEQLGERKPFDIMKKHFKAYVSSLPEGKELKLKLMEAKDAKEVERIIFDYLKKH